MAHCDLKPQNILVDMKEGEAAARDIAKAWREAKMIYFKFLLLFCIEHFIFLLPLLELKFTIGRRYAFA